MADVIRMPLLSDTMTEGKIAVWNKKVGDAVKSDESIADVETDKATMEVLPYVDGILLYVGVEAGQSAKVNDIIAIIGKAGENIDSLLQKKSPDVEPSKEVSIATPENTAVGASPSIEIPKELTIIRMPLLSDTMTEGKIVVWNKQVGDTVKADDALADVETDKATMEVIGYADGVLLYQGVKAGEAAKISEVIAVIGKAGTDITPYLSTLQHKEAANTIPEKSVSTASSIPTTPSVQEVQKVDTTSNGRIKASPLAKSIAKEKGIDLHHLLGSGDNGRIIKRDLDNVSSDSPVKNPITPSVSMPIGEESFTDIPVTQMRKIIAQRLSESKFTAPHFYLKISVEMDALLALRKQINDIGEAKISVNDMMMKACAKSLEKHPTVNSSWMNDFVRQNHHIHIGSAIALPEGLIVPVIKFANHKTLSQIASDASNLYEKARNKKIQPNEFTGNTFTISNLGMMDIEEFTAIINPPDACILAIGKTTPTPVVREGQIVIKQILKLTLSCDHRVVDGAVGAAFLQTLKSYLENPVGMLL